MGAFDAELHLRLLGEQTLAGSHDVYDEPPWGSRLRAVASALTAVGAITAQPAEAVLADYRLAAELRDEDVFSRSGRLFHVRQGAAVRVPGPLVPSRVVRCNRVAEHD